MENLITNGTGINAIYKNNTWVLDANSGAVIIEDIIPHVGDAMAKGETIQNVLNNLFENILPQIPIINHASMFKTNDDGMDSEYPDVSGLNKNSIYIRITFLNSTSPLYISCWLLQSDIEALKTIINSKASKSEYDSLLEEIEGKASMIQIEYLQEQINAKADKKQLDKLQAIVDKKANNDYVASLESTIFTKADKSTVEGLATSIANIESELTQFSTTNDLEQTNRAISEINEELSHKLDENDLANISDSLDNKADKSELSDLSKKVERIQNNDFNLGTINTKLNSLSLSVSKVDEKTFNNSTAIKKKADLSYVERIDTDLKAATTKLDIIVETKADKSDLSKKANKVDVDALINTNTFIKESVNQIRLELAKKADQTDVDEKYNEVKHLISDQQVVHRNDINQITNNLAKVGANIGKIETKLSEVDELASKSWIEIMSPEQYKRIHPSRIDPAKLYMCIKYNKPYALYIGSILIAERNSIESTGFTYTFPLTF